MESKKNNIDSPVKGTRSQGSKSLVQLDLEGKKVENKQNKRVERKSKSQILSKILAGYIS